ncbi:MAG: hypothetical protein ACYDCQ_19040, partial [Dehalococcoidia bacterium]
MASAAPVPAATATSQGYDAPTVELAAPQPSATGWTCTCGQLNPAGEEYCEQCGGQHAAVVANLGPG